MVFPESKVFTDRFHVVKLVLEALQHLRISYRWNEIEKENQAIKLAKLLLENYLLLKKAYKHTMEFRNMYEMTVKEDAKQKIINWITDTKLLEMNVFNTAANSLNCHLETSINFFINRNTNANAESFNAKIKLFRANQRGLDSRVNSYKNLTFF